MVINSLRSLYKRDLEKLASEIQAYIKEENLWIIDKGIANSAGNLCLHLLGNLNTFIGAVIGKTGYVRNRDLEFSQKDIPADELVTRIRELMETIDRTLANLPEVDLEKEYPMKVFDYSMTTGHFLIHLAVHLGYHLGQVNYHRRLLDANS